jgi:polyhydroxyalkanoate synthesis regulator phasin
LQIVESAQSIDELVPRLTADEQKKFIEEYILDSAKSDEEVPEEMQESVDDIPY